MEATIPTDKLGIILKVGMYAFLCFVGLAFIPGLLDPLGYFIAAALGTFAASAIANAVTVRIFERATITAIGLDWHSGAGRNLVVGLLGGVGSAGTVLALPLLFGMAELKPTPDQPGSFGSILFVMGLLIFGAIGEEMLFRGYGFQVLVAKMGPFATILPISVLFGFAHASNQNVSPLAIINTIGFGVVFGVAFLRSGDLWLPIGLHYGWNVTLPLFGVNLSGFTMGVTGYAMHWKVGDLWSGGAYGPEASILTCGIVIALMYYLWKAPIISRLPPLVAAEAAREEAAEASE
jgi:membrane protease YdiL (CAAX protease family)